MRRTVISALATLLAAAPARSAPRDTFARIDEIDRASLVMTTEAGIVPRPLARTIARARWRGPSPAPSTGSPRMRPSPAPRGPTTTCASSR